MTTTPPRKTPIILIAGHWLGAWAWDAVVDALNAAQWQAVPMTLPGLDPQDRDRRTRTLADQVGAIEQLSERLGCSQEEPAVIVAHSGANAPVTVFLDRHPDLVRRVIWVDSGPMASGTAFAPDLPKNIAELPLPPFDQLAGQASIEGLSDTDLQQFRERAVSQPASVLRDPVVLHDPGRARVLTTLVCCSFPSAQVLELARSGHPMFAPIAELERVDVVDLSTGHWPMWSRPQDLAQLILRKAAVSDG
jgi:pimeloyl-ACP methyl ester carboxylesterase